MPTVLSLMPVSLSTGAQLVFRSTPRASRSFCVTAHTCSAGHSKKVRFIHKMVFWRVLKSYYLRNFHYSNVRRVDSYLRVRHIWTQHREFLRECLCACSQQKRPTSQESTVANKFKFFELRFTFEEHNQTLNENMFDSGHEPNCRFFWNISMSPLLSVYALPQLAVSSIHPQPLI